MTKGKIVFTGHFGSFFLTALALTLLSIITLGLLLPYLFYWQFKYFFTHMEIELYTTMTAMPGPTNSTQQLPAQPTAPQYVPEGSRQGTTTPTPD